MYKTRQDAESGKNPGGTGFIISYPVSGVYVQYYGITNRHVACRDGISVVRINTADGGTDVFEYGSEDWEFIPAGPDIAVIPLDLDYKIHNIYSVELGLIANRENLTRLTVGDDVFMLGLFVDHAGKTTNTPLARFGNISMAANSKASIKQPTGYDGESYIIDLHSRSGFSGSLVYVYRTPLSDLSTPLRGKVDLNSITRQLERYSSSTKVDVELQLPTSIFWLLGIHWAQFPEKWQLENAQTISESERNSLVGEANNISGLSGMTCVIPS